MNPALLATVAAIVGVVVVIVVALLVARATRRRWQAQLDAARADVDALRARLDAIDAPATQHPPTTAGPSEFLITSLPETPTSLHVAEPASDRARAEEPMVGQASAPTADRFATVALGESLVRLVSLGYGVRRALSAENRNRIRFEMRREVKRARRQRRRDLKEAKRQLRHVATGAAEDAA